METTQDRFWSKVAVAGEFDCWEWQASRHEQGYGYFVRDGRTTKAHRVAYEWFWGDLPKGLVVRHTCDNPPCVNPAHLVAGTHKDNTADCIERGGFRRTIAAIRRLTEDDVRFIRATKPPIAATARRLGVGYNTVKDALLGRTWKDVS